MATEIKMPQLSDTMDSGKILAWRKKEGEPVARGQILAEVETDKANLEIECFVPGILLKILLPVGAKAKVGEPIAVIGSAEELTSGTFRLSSPGERTKEPLIQTQPSSKPIEIQQTSATSSQERIKASPLARKLAEDMQVDLSAIKGSGPGGRIVREDVIAAAALPERKSTQEQIPPSAPIPSAAKTTTDGKLTPLSKMRQTIAKRMVESVTTAPHFFVTISINMEQSLKLHSVLKEKPEYKGISLNHLIIKAAAYALKQEPRLNCSIRDGQIFEPNHINIGIITSTEEGLLIPVVKEADKLSLKEVALEARSAVERARTGHPSPTDLVGGTFSISNMGMFDIEAFTAIISPGQGAALAIGAVKEEPVVQDGKIIPCPVMKATLSVDHRASDGVAAASFLKHFKEALEIPGLALA